MWKKTKEMKWKTAKLLWGDLFYDIAGAVLFAAGVYTFAGNADFAPGGITGISLLLNHLGKRTKTNRPIKFYTPSHHTHMGVGNQV